MLSVLLVALLFHINSGYQYFPEPRTFAQAKAYCASIGTELATIIDDPQRMEALASIAGGESPWIGLEHVTDKETGKCQFMYPSEPNVICPTGDYRCVSFWAIGSPNYIISGGNKCTIYDRLALNGDGGIDNDIDCETKRATLCNCDANGVCTNEDWKCDGIEPLNWCGPGCFCDKTGFGNTQCIADTSCAPWRNSPCTADAHCPGAKVCITTSCCSHSACVDLCDPDRFYIKRRMFEENNNNNNGARRLEGSIGELACSIAFNDPLCPR